MASTANTFASINTIVELYSAMDALMSPENLYQDGERSVREAKAEAKRLKHDFEHRISQIRLDEINAIRNERIAEMRATA